MKPDAATPFVLDAHCKLLHWNPREKHEHNSDRQRNRVKNDYDDLDHFKPV
jgi:hypothetical protein